MRRLDLIGIICIPVSFLVSGIGMLWLTKFSNIEGGFYDRLLSHATDWVGSHLVLLASTCMLIPAAISIRSAVGREKGSMLASVGTSLVCVASLLLAGQYAIDLVMPLVARAGGSALDVHKELSSYPVTNLLFYELPQVVFIGVLLTHLALFRAKIISSSRCVLLVVLWVTIIFGNIFEQTFLARGAIFVLGISLIRPAQEILRMQLLVKT